MTLTIGAPEQLAGRPAGDAQAPRGQQWWLLVPILLALLLRLVLILRPGYLTGVTEYDDGVYVTGTLRLLQGVLPYRNYVDVSPPGILLLFAPFAAIAHLVSTPAVLATGRVLTSAVDVIDVGLVGRLLRHRPIPARVAAMLLMALYPAELEAAHTVLLEPYLTLLCLLAARCLFDRDQLAPGRRLLPGGALLGAAATVKAFAVLPLGALVVVLLVRRRPALAGGVAAAGAGAFLALVAPFAAGAPRRFLTEAVLDQLSRIGVGRTPVATRLGYGDGLAALTSPGAPLLEVMGAVLVAAVLVTLLRAGLRRELTTPLAAFSLLTAVVIVGALAWTGTVYPHYFAFLTPFAALTLGSIGGPPNGRHRLPMRPAVAVVVAALLILGDVHTIAVSDARQVGSPVAAAVPSGMCVISDNPGYLLVAGRSEVRRGCPDVVDPFGTTMALTGGRSPQNLERYGGAGAANRYWIPLLRRARYLVLSWEWTGPIPATPAVRALIRRRFTVVARLPRGAGTVLRAR